MGPPLTSSTSVVTATVPVAAPPRGPATDIFNFGGGRCRTCHQHPQGPDIEVFNFGGGRCRTCCEHPPGGPLLTSSTLMVAAVGPANSP
jgi:hypothetical protein